MRSNNELTLMAVHAHPDDEASSTGGVLARYSRDGVNTIVVTCTNGALGDAPGGIKPDDPSFDEELVIATRRRELDASCALLGVRHLERLDYQDSGMMGWPANSAPGAFWQMSIEEAAKPLVGLMEQYRPQVVITYDSNGSYGHPDHIQAHRITLHATEVTGIPDKLYYPVIPRSAWREFAPLLRAAGLDDGDEAGEEAGDGGTTREEEFGTPDELITTQVDCHEFVGTKYAALAAHASQTDQSFFMKLPIDLFNRIFGLESFIRHLDRTGEPTPETDLFAGIG
jgi:LmbE family N-acetylglucosaminyl deacetylase